MKIIHKLLVFTVLFIFSCTENKTNEIVLNGYSISYTKDEWELVENKDFLLLYSKIEEVSGFNSNINIIIQDLPNNLASLKSFHGFSKNQIQEVEGKNAIISDKDIIISNIEAKELVFKIFKKNQKGRKRDLLCKQIYIVYKRKAYVITYTSDTEYFDTLLISADNVLNSFSLD